MLVKTDIKEAQETLSKTFLSEQLPKQNIGEKQSFMGQGELL